MKDSAPTSPPDSDQQDLARRYSAVSHLGPRLGEALARLIDHLFTPVEAAVLRHVPFYRPRSLAGIARRAGRSAEEIQPLLRSLARRRIIVGGRRGYALLPLLPGIFEHMLMTGVDSPWHRRFARLLDEVFESGYFGDYLQKKVPLVRNIPVDRAVDSRSRVVDDTFISAMLDRHEHFGVLNVCQCRQAMHFNGRDCRRARPEDGCLVFGEFAVDIARRGNGRQVTRAEMRVVVEERWARNLVLMTGNVGAGNPNAICTCCDCCCYLVRSVNNYGGRNYLAPSPFVAAVDDDRCTHCGRCVAVCNTHAHVRTDGRHGYHAEACIGCGLCVDVCPPAAIRLVENPAFRPPAKSFPRLGLRLLPPTVGSLLLARWRRRHSGEDTDGEIPD
ncbi:MAG: 4Fe-4S binding protein [Acidobacteria bacterium]|nr:4Fe-4S binding protein [Acidobacteriota bacterium]